MVGEAGVERVLEMDLPADERSALERSAASSSRRLCSLAWAKTRIDHVYFHR